MGSSTSVHETQDLTSAMSILLPSRTITDSEVRLRPNTFSEALIEARERLGVQDIHHLTERRILPEGSQDVPLVYDPKRGTTSLNASLAESCVAKFVERLPESWGNYIVINRWALKDGQNGVTEIDVFVIHPTKGMIFIEVGTTEGHGGKKLNQNQTQKARDHLYKRFLTHERPEHKQAADEIFGSFLCYTILTKIKPKQANFSTMPSTSIVLFKEHYNQDSFDEKVKFGTIPREKMDFYSTKVYPFLVTQYILDNAFVPVENSADKIEQVSLRVDNIRGRESLAAGPVPSGKAMKGVIKQEKGLYLSAEQCGILQRHDKKLQIAGVAGTGKTLLLYQKMKLCLDRDEKCLFLASLKWTTCAILEKTRQVFKFWEYDDEEKLQIMDLESLTASFKEVFEHVDLKNADLVCGCEDQSLTKTQSDFLSKWRSVNVFVDEVGFFEIEQSALRFLFLVCPHHTGFQWITSDYTLYPFSLKWTVSHYPLVSLSGVYRSPANFLPLIKWTYKRISAGSQERIPCEPTPIPAHGKTSHLRPKILVVIGAKGKLEPALVQQIVRKEKMSLSGYKESQITHIQKFYAVMSGDAEIDYRGCQNDIIISECEDQYKFYMHLTRALVGFVAIMSEKSFWWTFASRPDETVPMTAEIARSFDIVYVDEAGRPCRPPLRVPW